MITDGVVGVLVTTAELRQPRRRRRHLFVKDLIAEPLSQLDLGPRPRQPNFEISNAAVNLGLDVTGQSLDASRRAFKRLEGSKTRQNLYWQSCAPLLASRNRLPHRRTFLTLTPGVGASMIP